MGDFLDETIGQDTAKRFVHTAIKKGNLYNFLLVGPKGVGKRMFAFNLAKMLGCSPHSSNFMLIAPIPSHIKEKTEKISEYMTQYLPDNPVIEFEDRSAILIEQIRIAITNFLHMPLQGTKRVTLILEADRMTDEAANCFLKTLEEPPVDTVFILTSSRPDYLLPTIRSRCRTVPFTYLTQEQVKDILFEGEDAFSLGSPGELMLLKNDEMIKNAYDIFTQCPLSVKKVSLIARDHRKKSLMDILYPLMLLYRLALYRSLHLVKKTAFDQAINKKLKKVPASRLMDTISLLNMSINSLEQNPNRYLLLLNILLQLP